MNSNARKYWMFGLIAAAVCASIGYHSWVKSEINATRSAEASDFDRGDASPNCVAMAGEVYGNILDYCGELDPLPSHSLREGERFDDPDLGEYADLASDYTDPACEDAEQIIPVGDITTVTWKDENGTLKVSQQDVIIWVAPERTSSAASGSMQAVKAATTCTATCTGTLCTPRGCTPENGECTHGHCVGGSSCTFSCSRTTTAHVASWGE